jgi:hypothetical protein
VASSRKTLPSAAGFGYNPHSLEASGSFNPFDPRGPTLLLLASLTHGPLDKRLFVNWTTCRIDCRRDLL